MFNTEGGFNSTVPPNEKPVAVLGSDVSGIVADSQVILDFSGSYDSDGTIEIYTITQTEGDTVVLSGTGDTREYTAPKEDYAQDLIFELIVKDDAGDSSEPVYITHSILAYVPIVPTIAASFSGTLTDGGTFTPTVEGDKYTSIAWTCTSGQSPTFDTATELLPDITVNDSGEHTFRVTATSVDGETAFSEFTVLVEALPAADTPPTTVVGANQSVAAGASVQLDASSSTPGTYPIASYEWTQTAGDTVALEDETTATPTFESPVTTAAQRVSFDVIAIDTDGNRSAAAAVHIDVAAFVTSALLKLLDTRRWELHHDGTVQAFEGRANREAFRFKLIPDDGVLNDADGFFRFDQPGIDSVEVLSSTSSSVSSTDDPDMIREVVIAARTGDLKGEDPNNIELTFVLYVTGDSDGLVMTASEMVPYQSASYFRR